MQSPINPDPKVAKLYQDVPKESLIRLQEFRKKYPYQAITIGDHTWNFIDSGEGENVLFVPAGGTAIAEVSFNSLEHFAQNLRIIAPDYPPIEDLQELCEGFIGLLDRLGVENFYTMGGSYGGLMAQSFVRQYPERIDKLVISAVGPPNRENSQELARLMGWLRITPTFLLRWMINRSFARLERNRTHSDEMTLLWAVVREAVYFRLGRADILALLQRLINQTDNYTFSAHDLEGWVGKILLVFGSEDPSTPAEIRQAMADLYPQAEIILFEGGEHGIAITHQQEYFQVIDEFLASR